MKGITVMELVTVISAIGVLSVMMMSMSSNIVQKAKVNVIFSSISQLISSQDSYKDAFASFEQTSMED